MQITKTGMILHWTAGRYTPNEHEKDSYHGGVIWDGKTAQFVKWRDYTGIISHTLRRNTLNIGLTVCAMAGASERDWGICPMKKEQIDELCLAAAEIAFLKNIDTSRIMTHAEAAILDGYFGERWDLARLEEGAISQATAKATGDKLRKKIREIKLELIAGKRQTRRLHFANKK